MEKKLSDFTNQFQVSHTLKFELKPIGKTEENLKKSGLLEKDFKRAEDYPKVKEFLDEQHKQFLQKVLGNINDIDWQPLADQIEALQKTKSPQEKESLKKAQDDYRKKITEKFSNDDLYSILVKEPTPSKLFKQVLKSSPETSDEIKMFASFSCYFKGYQENRKNIYSNKAQQTAAAYRAVNENFTKFFNAVKIYSEFQAEYPDLINDINSRTLSLCEEKTVSELFQVNSYNSFLSQSGIDFINTVIGEINYAVNQFRQKHQEIKTAKLPFIPVLYKQILSDRDKAFVINSFETDAEVYSALKNFISNIQNTEINGNNVALFPSLQKELCNLNETSDLFIDAKYLEKISGKTAGSWNTISEAMSTFAEKNIKGKTTREKYCKRSAFNLQEINSWNICKLAEDKLEKVDISTFWNGEYSASLFANEKKLLPELERMLSSEPENLHNNKGKAQIIKDYLDVVQEIFHLLKPIAVSTEYGGDLNLLNILTVYYSKLESIVQLYNQVRNYITQKATDVAKIKLMFDKPTLADGWDNNKEDANLTLIFRKEDKFFLGIIKTGSKIDFDGYANANSDNCYQKMIYKLLPGPNKQLPRVFFAKCNIDYFAPDKELLHRYENGDHLKGKNFDLTFCHKLIDFFKSSIAKHEDWSKFNFQFSPTSSYNGIDDFYKEVSDQGYILKFINISENIINKLVEDGKLFLFQIYNKDFSEKSNGTPNKSTLYWQEIFSSENSADVIFKLNGEAELFMRKAADIKTEPAHAAGEKMVNRTVVIGFEKEINGQKKALRESIPQSIHEEIFLYENGKISNSNLSNETKAHLEKYPILNWITGLPIDNALNRTIVKTAAFDIIKDKRFTKEKYLFHVPITINFKADAAQKKFNEKVLEYLSNNPDVKIIGLDRGERNLIYLMLMDQQGNILEQKSLNIINGVDYHEKLDMREKERDHARKSWQEIGNIKDLKAGYLSGVIYEITRMMIEHNAIVVMEDLNFGFKRGRMKIEKQIYQKFEKALIDKLNYLVFKNQQDHHAPGGVLKGYQLTNKLESFAKLGKQCGFIFYVPAGYTSKIDPATGFINIFDTKECTNAENIKDFLCKFDAIRYDANKDAFAFEFDYSKFKTHQTDYQNTWTVYSTKEAWQQEKDKSSGKFSSVFHNPTEDIKNAITKLDLTLKDNFDLLELLRTVKAENSTAAFFKSIFYAFKLSVALRHSSKDKDLDKIISPVMDCNGKFFTSSSENDSMPIDADANGAYHIALKGLFLLHNGIKDQKLSTISSEEWIKFAQTRNNK